MRYTVPLLLASLLPAQNVSVVATIDGVADVTARFQTIDRPYLLLSMFDSPLLVYEVGNPQFGWFWSYFVPPYVFRDGAVERVGMQYPATLRLPLEILPPGEWWFRAGTHLGYSDTVTVRVL